MLIRFEIHSVKRTKREYTYYDVFLTSSITSRERKGIEYMVELTATDGERYFLFHQGKSDPAMRPYKIMYVDAVKLESRDGTKYSPEHEGAYKIRRTYEKHPFGEAVKLLKENLEKRQKTDAAELERLAALV